MRFFSQCLRRNRLFAMLGTCGVLLGVTQVSAEIMTNFDAGNTTSNPNGYQGQAGDGWSSAWASHTNSVGELNGTVTNTNPLQTGAGNYLSVTISNSDNDSTTSAAMAARNHDVVYGGVDTDQPHIVSFLFRPEQFDSDSLYRIFERHGTAKGADAATRWYLRAGTDGWSVYDGDGDGGASGINTGMDLVEGRTYQVTITVDPTSYSYTVGIADGVQADYLSPTLGFRNDTNLSRQIQWGGKDDTGDDLIFSLDSIQITNIPEPGSMALMIGGGVLALIRGSGRSQR